MLLAYLLTTLGIDYIIVKAHFYFLFTICPHIIYCENMEKCGRQIVY